MRLSDGPDPRREEDPPPVAVPGHPTLFAISYALPFGSGGPARPVVVSGLPLTVPSPVAYVSVLVGQSLGCSAGLRRGDAIVRSFLGGMQRKDSYSGHRDSPAVAGGRYP